MPDFIKIHEYPIERLVFGDDDYYDVDYFDGLGYQSAKIKGSVIKQAVQGAYQPPFVDVLATHRTGGVNIHPNTNQGFHLNVNGTGNPAKIDFNIPLRNNGIDYDGSNLKLRIYYAMATSNSGGNVSFEVNGYFLTADGTQSADTLGSVTVTNVDVTGRIINNVYNDEIYNASGPANSDYLILSIKRITTGGVNNDSIEVIGVKLVK